MMKDKVIKLIEQAEKDLQETFKKVDRDALINSEKVLDAFHTTGISEADFTGTTGYGYGDFGRDKIESIFARIFHAEDALVRSQIISGSHALTIALFGVLRPNDTLLSITGKPYDTLDAVIGIDNNSSSLKAFGVKYKEIDLIEDDFDYKAIEKKLKEEKIKLIEIQRSIGYSLRKSISIEKIEKLIAFIKKIDQDVIIMIDNCYTEFVGIKTPCEVGADLVVGSLIKNLGGFIASNGGYIAGKKELIHLCSERLNLPGEAKEVGPSMGANKMFLQGLYLAPSVVANSLKTAYLASYLLEMLGYKVSPTWKEERSDIVETIWFNDEEKLIKFIEGIQAGGAIDSNVTPIPVEMPGYKDKVIMASASFTQGSSIELSCDGPLRSPYVAYLQGGVTYEYGKLGIIKALIYLLENEKR